MSLRIFFSLVASFILLILVAGCDDLSEEEVSTMIQQELVRQMNAGELDWKRFPVIKINLSRNRATLSNFPEELKRWIYGAGFVKKGRGVPFDVVTPSGQVYMESTPSIIDATEKVQTPTGIITERSFTFYTHTIEDIQISWVKRLGDESYEVTYKPFFKRVKDDYMRHVPHWSEPVPNRKMIFVKYDSEWKIQ